MEKLEERQSFAGRRSARDNDCPHPSQTKILVVDDERTLRELLADSLTEDGYVVETAASGTEALEKLHAPGQDYGIVITDLKLPGVSGVEVLRQARELDPWRAVIIITGFATVESAVECMKAGAQDYITKPLKLDELRLIVARAAERLFLLGEAEKKKYFEELSRLDGLTQVFNHRYFHQTLDAELERSKRGGRSLPLLMIDIDDFKKVNDNYGHQAGDCVLRKLAHLLTTLMRLTDHVARYGGEEFTVILTETDRQGALVAAERIRRATEQAKFLPDGLDKEIHITVSVGVASYPEDAEDGKSLISKADQALYSAKAAGKNKVRSAQ
jgi:diguanylate cyclase (GGDEF)-like protein